jgi:hypothetical protein
VTGVHAGLVTTVDCLEDTMTENPRPIRGEEDTEGHLARNADAEAIEGEQDTEGHLRKRFADAEAVDDEDDVAGHVQPRSDLGR